MSSIRSFSPNPVIKRRKIRKFGEKPKCNYKSLFNCTDQGLSISLKPLVLKNHIENLKSGCILTVNGNERQIDSVTLPFVIAKLESKLATLPTEDICRSINILLLGADKCQDIAKAEQSYKTSEEQNGSAPLAGEDELDWLIGQNHPILRPYALIRRMAMKMYLHDLDKASILVQLPFSLLDVLLGVKQLKQVTVESILVRMVSIHDNIEKCELKDAATRFKALEKRLMRTLHRVGGTVSIEPLEVDLKNIDFEALKQLLMSKPSCSQQPIEECTVSENLREAKNVKAARRLLMQEYEHRKKGSSTKERAWFSLKKKIPLPNRRWHGSLLITEKDMSHEDFCEEVQFVAKVNQTFPRVFYPNISRPRLQKIDISEGNLLKLKSFFFDSDGRLRRSICGDVDLTSRHGYINFANITCQEERKDHRWQVPLKRHTMKLVPTRCAVESFLSEQKLLHPEHERIHDLGILIGGTEDQSLHHDIPRQTTCWFQEAPAKGVNLGLQTPGWEIDRLDYNDAMASRYAPSSLIFGMGDNRDLYVGVQKNYVERNGCQPGYCKIIDGRPGEEFRVVRENEFLVVLHAQSGVVFTGDFPHAGVRNFAPGTLEDKLMKDFNGRIQAILEDGAEQGEYHRDMIRDIITMMTQFKHLDKLCRLHGSTEPLKGPLTIPRNSVGFTECLPNPPDPGFPS